MNRIFIDGDDFTKHTAGLNDDDFNLEFSLDDETKTIVYSVSNELTFTNSAFDYLNEKFVTNCDMTVSADVTIRLGCCNEKELSFTILPSGIEWSKSSCNFSATLRRNTEIDEPAKILSEKLYWKDNGWRTAFKHPVINYCRENELIAILYSVLFVILFPLIAGVSIIQAFFGSSSNLRDDFEKKITGCNRRHIGTIYREMAEYNAGRVGLSFQSSILQDAYKTLILIHARNKKGCLACDYQEENMPALTTIGALGLLDNVFNASARIINKTLYYETEKFYNELYFDTLVDVTTIDAPEEPVYSYNTEDLKAYGRFEYRQDAIDTEGNQMFDTYSDIVEWNPSTSLNRSQKGEKVVTVPFSPCRFRLDAESNSSLDGLRVGKKLIMQGNTSSEYKLILWTGEDRNNVEPEWVEVGSTTEYQRRLWFNENQSTPELYQQYHYYSNPRSPEARNIVLESFEFSPSDFCAAVDKVLEYGVYLEVITDYGSGIPQTIKINFTKKTIEIENVYLKCS